MNATSSISQHFFGFVNGWQIARTADFDGDGYDDIIWQHTSTGSAVAWFMNGAQQKSALPLSGPTTWRIVAF
jgi:hypothetical protein